MPTASPTCPAKGEWMAALLAAGDGAALAGMCSAAMLKITKLEPTEIEVIVPGNRRPQAGFRLRTCRNLSPRDIVIVDRIPVTTVARTLVDLSDDKDADELAFLMHEAAYPGDLLARGHAGGDGAGERAPEPRRARRGAAAAPERERRDAQPAREAVPPAGAGRRAPRAAGPTSTSTASRSTSTGPGLCVEIDGGHHARPADAGRRPDPRRRAAGGGLHRPALQRGRPQRASRDAS